MEPIKPLNSKHQALHSEAVRLVSERAKTEHRLIVVLQEIQREKLYRFFGSTSLFKYAVDVLGLSGSVAYYFINVARKAMEVPELQKTLFEQSLSVSKASRIASSLDKSNAREILEFAKTHTTREIDGYVAKINPKAATPDRVKVLSESHVQISASLRKSVFEKIQRAKSVADKGTLDEVLDIALEEYLNRHDPVRKARRVLSRKSEKKAMPDQDRNVKCNEVSNESFLSLKRRPESHENAIREIGVDQQQASRKLTVRRRALKAQQCHEVNVRDQGRCTFRDPAGNRCENDRWLEKHHIHEVRHGGNNEARNLTTLCSFHHDLVHQLSLPLDGEFNWWNVGKC